MAQALMRYKDSAGVWHDIPFRPTAAVLSVNGKNGIVDLVETDIPNLTTHIDSKLVKPATAGTLDQVLASDGAGNTKWITLGPSGVESVNGKSGIVVLTANDVGAYAKNETYNKTETYNKDEVNTLVDGRIEEPSGTRSYGVSPIANSDGSLVWQKLVERVNGKYGNVTLNSADIKMVSGTETVEAAINSKINQPATAGTVGQVLTKTASGEEWQTPINAPVLSVNTKVGDVVLAAADIKMADGTTTVEVGINSKFNKPTGSASAHRVITSDGAGGAYWYDAVNRVNGKYGYVELKGSDIKVSASDTRTIDAALDNMIIGGKINGADLTISDKKIIIPIAGTSTTNTTGSLGVVSVDINNGFNVNGNGSLEFSTEAIPSIGAAHKNTSAPEYDMTKMYQVGDYVQYKGRYYVCKTSNSTGVFTLANFYETSTTAERNNLLAQLIAALGIQEKGPRRWDNTNNKIVYDFDMI